MTNVEKLKPIGIIGEVRTALGASDEYDTSLDEQINNLSSNEIMLRYCTHHFGSGYWWAHFKRIFDAIERLG